MLGLWLSGFGSKVTIVKRSPGILRFAEPELTNRLAEILQSEGIDITTTTAFKRGRWENGKKVLAVSANREEKGITGDDGKCLWLMKEYGPGPPPKREVPGSLVALDFTLFLFVVCYHDASYGQPEFTYPPNSILRGYGKFESMKYYHWIKKDKSGYEKTYVLRQGSGKQYRIIYSDKTDDINSFNENINLLKLIGFRQNLNK